MKAIRISEERQNQILPQNIKDTDVLSDNAKKTLATIMNYYLLLEEVKNNGYVYLNNKTLGLSVGLRNSNMLSAVLELIEHNLITREVGKRRTEGEPSTASVYRVMWQNLTKPLRKNTFEELFSEFLKSSETPLGIADTVTVSGPVSDTETVEDTVTNSVEISDINSTSVDDGKKRPKNQKELKEYFKNRMDVLCKDKNVDELNEIQEVLKTELDEFNEINGYQDVFKYFVIPAIEKKKERLSSKYLVDIMTTA